VDDVNWRAAPPASSYSLHLFGLASKEREGWAIFVRSPYSIEYRYSPSPSPSSPFFFNTFFFLFQKICVGFVFLFSSALRHHNMPSFPSPRLSIRSLLPQRNLLPSRSPVCIPYRSVLYYTTYLYSSKRPLYSGRHSAVFVFRNQDTAMYRAAPYSAVIPDSLIPNVVGAHAHAFNIFLDQYTRLSITLVCPDANVDGQCAGKW